MTSFRTLIALAVTSCLLVDSWPAFKPSEPLRLMNPAALMTEALGTPGNVFPDVRNDETKRARRRLLALTKTVLVPPYTVTRLQRFEDIRELYNHGYDYKRIALFMGLRTTSTQKYLQPIKAAAPDKLLLAEAHETARLARNQEERNPTASPVLAFVNGLEGDPQNVFVLLAARHSIKQIAETLQLPLKAVYHYQSRIQKALASVVLLDGPISFSRALAVYRAHQWGGLKPKQITEQTARQIAESKSDLNITRIILAKVGMGWRYKRIAEELSMSAHFVQKQVVRLERALSDKPKNDGERAHARVNLTMFAHRNATHLQPHLHIPGRRLLDALKGIAPKLTSRDSKYEYHASENIAKALRPLSMEEQGEYRITRLLAVVLLQIYEPSRRQKRLSSGRSA